MEKLKNEEDVSGQRRGSIKRKLIVFSFVLFFIILACGGTAFFLSMKQIVDTGNRNQLIQTVEIERISLEASVDAEIAIALKMADSPLIKQHFVNPSDRVLRKIAFDEIEAYRNAFKSHTVFWASDTDREFYFSEDNHYRIDTEDPNNYWYKMTLYETKVFNFNINYNAEIKKTMLFINAPVFDSARKPIGLVGTGIDLTEFVDSLYKSYKGSGPLYFFNALGEITGARDTNLIANKVKLDKELGAAGAEILSWTKTNTSDAIKTFSLKEGEFAVGSIQALDWYVTVLHPRMLSDYIRTSMTRLFFIMLIAIAAILVIFNWSTRVVLRPLNRIIKVLNHISADWDLTKRIEVKQNDETGTLADFFNQTFERIKELLLTIRDDAVSLTKTGEDLSSNMTRTSAAITKINTNIHSMKSQVLKQANEVNVVSGSMEKIIGGLDNLNDNIAEQVNSVNRSSSAIEEMLANIRAVTETLVKNTANINSLGESSRTGREDLRKVSLDIQEIAKESEGLLQINSVMQAIASQTNLLAMNAAIEAAHAGESGKGFAVVADEIRKLAENSGKQSKTISTVLKKIKSSIDAITKSTGIVLERFEAITTDVDTVSNQESQIRSSMEEQEAGSRQILEAIGQLNSITGLVKSASEKMAEESQGIIIENQGLKQITEEVAAGMDEMAYGADQISTAVNKVNEISGANNSKISNLHLGISKFRLEKKTAE